MSDAGALPLAEVLLAPLVESAADTLRALDPTELPLALRQLQGFDRRGLQAGPAQRQLRKALDTDGDFRARVVADFTQRPEVAAVLERFGVDDAPAAVVEADERGDLALFVSALWAARPPGYEFGLGLAVAAHDGRRREDVARGSAEAEHRRREEADEARRRAEHAREVAEAETTKLATQLRDLRAERRARDEKAAAATAAAERRADALAAELAQARAAEESSRAKEGRAAQRAKELEAHVQRLRAQVAEHGTDAPPSRPAALQPSDARVLTQAAETARRLGATIDEVVGRAGRGATAPPPTDAPPADRPRARRASPEVPPGLVADSAMGAEAMLRGRDVVLVVDGYNVTQRAWSDAPLADQRARLAQGLAAMHARLGCDAVVVFDGDGSGAIKPLRRVGLRVEFSDPDEEADEVVVREVEALPKRVPVVVASSDAWVREHAERAGAVVVSADTLLAVLRG